MIPCPREPQIVHAFTAAATRQLSADQRDHVRDCGSCREALVVSSALLAADVAGAGAPSADVVWFRAQLKARAEAASLAARPVFVAQAIAGATVAGAVVAVTGAMGGLEVITLATRGLVLAFAVWLLIAPVAVYLAATED